jgi:hypothetical protein
MTQPFRIKNDLEATDDFICNSPLIVGPDFDGLNTTALISALSNNATALLVYDFTDNTTLRQARDGTSPVTAAGQSVGRILDLGPGAYHATAQTSDANRGLWQGAETGIVFDGVDDGYQTATLAVSGATHLQIFAGVRKLSDVAGIIAEFGASFLTFGGWYLIYEVTSTRYGFAPRGARTAGGNDQASVPGFAAPDTAVLYARVDLTGGAAQLGRNGGALQNSIVTTWGGGGFADLVLNIGRRNASSLPFNGHLRSLIVRYANADLSSGLITAAEQWTAARAGVTLP